MTVSSQRSVWPARTASRSGLILLVAGGLTLMAFCLWIVPVEIGPYVRASQAAMADAAPAPPDQSMTLSIAGQELALFDCRVAMKSIAGLTQPTDIRQKTIADCISMSKGLTENEPSFSVAWLTGALASAEAGNWQQFNEKLVRSQVTGRLEQWVAEMRVDLAEEYFERLSAKAAAGETDDLKLLIQSDRGIASIAARYIDDVLFRDRLTSVLEKMSARDQSHFLKTLKLLVRERLS